MTLNQHTELAISVCAAFMREEEPDIPEDRSNMIDPHLLLPFLKRHKLIPIFNNYSPFLSHLVPDAVNDQIKKRSQNSVLRNLQFYRTAKKIKETFLAENVWTEPYKGISFSSQFYKNIALRPSVDIDFAIRFDQLDHCTQIMKRMGYSTDDEFTTQRRMSRAYFIDYQWSRKINGMYESVEFHLAPAHKALYLPIDFKHYSESPNTPSFSKIDHALFIIIHHGVVDLWGKFLHLVDLHQIRKGLSQSEFEQLMSECSRIGITRFVNLGFEMLKRIFNVDHDTIGVVPDKSLIQKIVYDCLQSNLSGKWSKDRTKIIYHIRLRDNLQDKFNSIKALSRYSLFRYTGI